MVYLRAQAKYAIELATIIQRRILTLELESPSKGLLYTVYPSLYPQHLGDMQNKPSASNTLLDDVGCGLPVVKATELVLNDSSAYRKYAIAMYMGVFTMCANFVLFCRIIRDNTVRYPNATILLRRYTVKVT